MSGALCSSTSPTSEASCSYLTIVRRIMLECLTYVAGLRGTWGMNQAPTKSDGVYVLSLAIPSPKLASGFCGLIGF